MNSATAIAINALIATLNKMSPEHITALIVGGFTILGGVAAHVISWFLARSDRKYQRAFDRAEKQWGAQFRMIEATKENGCSHVIKPLRYWLLSEISMDAVGPTSIFTPVCVRRWKLDRRQKQLIGWLEDADVLEQCLYTHEINKSSQNGERPSI